MKLGKLSLFAVAALATAFLALDTASAQGGVEIRPGRPGWGHDHGGRPGWGRPDHGRPGWGRPDHGRPGWGRPGHGHGGRW